MKALPALGFLDKSYLTAAFLIQSFRRRSFTGISDYSSVPRACLRACKGRQEPAMGGKAEQGERAVISRERSGYAVGHGPGLYKAIRGGRTLAGPPAATHTVPGGRT